LLGALRQGWCFKKIIGYSFGKNAKCKMILVPNGDTIHIKKMFDLAT
jgi:hypothetical protein